MKFSSTMYDHHTGQHVSGQKDIHAEIGPDKSQPFEAHNIVVLAWP